MRLPFALVCLLLLPLAGCDSNDDTGLAVCGFSAMTEGIVSEEVAGSARYTTRTALDSTTVHGVEMTVSAVNGSVSRIRLIGELPTERPEGEAVFNPSPGSSGGWVGFVDGNRPLQSTGGTVRIILASEDRIEGEFNMTAETDDGRTSTVEGRFNAGFFPMCR